MFVWVHLNNKPWLNMSKKRKRAQSSIDVWKLFHSQNHLFLATVSDSLPVKARSEGHSLCPTVDLYKYCVWDDFLWSFILIPCSVYSSRVAGWASFENRCLQAMWDTYNPHTAVWALQQCFLCSPAYAWAVSQQGWSCRMRRGRVTGFSLATPAERW